MPSEPIIDAWHRQASAHVAWRVATGDWSRRRGILSQAAVDLLRLHAISAIDRSAAMRRMCRVVLGQSWIAAVIAAASAAAAWAILAWSPDTVPAAALLPIAAGTACLGAWAITRLMPSGIIALSDHLRRADESPLAWVLRLPYIPVADPRAEPSRSSRQAAPPTT